MAEQIEGLVKFNNYSELKPVAQKYDKVVILNMKDGSHYYLTNQEELAKYSNRADVQSFMFFYDGDDAPEQADAGFGELDAGPEQPDAGASTVATVSVPSKPVSVPPKPQGGVESLPILMGAIAGAVSSAGMPALNNLAKKLLKDMLKGKSKAGEEKQEVTDCKTHQIQSNARMTALSSRVTVLESQSKPELQLPSDDMEELVDRIEKLEKQLKPPKKTKKKK
jgi:hypothetical protein